MLGRGASCPRYTEVTSGRLVGLYDVFWRAAAASACVGISNSPRRDLNSRPLVYKTSALTPELRRRRGGESGVLPFPYPVTF